MGGELSSSKNQTCPLPPEVVTSIEQCIQDGDFKRLQQLLRGFSRERYRSLLSTSPQLPMCVHLAVMQKNKDLLKLLVECCGASLEYRDEKGRTPLYNAVLYQWSQGALFLLEKGANVQNAEVKLSGLLFPQIPLIHLAVRTRSEELITELLDRGVRILVKDSEGNDCLDVCHHQTRCHFSRILFQRVLGRLQRQPNFFPVLDKDLLFIVRIGTKCLENYTEVENFIKRQPSYKQGQLYQVLGACSTLRSCYKSALCYWRISEQKMTRPLNDHDAKDKPATDSVFADICQVDKSLLLEGERFSDERMDNFDVQALFVLEHHIPEDRLLTEAVLTVADRLLQRNKPVVAMGLLRRLTSIRTLYRDETVGVLKYVNLALHKLQWSSDTRLPALMDSMQTLCRCLAFIKGGQIPSVKGCTCLTRSPMCCYISALLRTMSMFCDRNVRATPQQRQGFDTHITNFISTFPKTCSQTLFHYVGHEVKHYLPTARIAKTLLTCSPDAVDTYRQEDSAIHLVPDQRGDTPLHVFARHLSPEDLMEEGVLQCFLDYGADVFTKNNQGHSVHDILVERGVFSKK